jgi:ligand-binding sensor domain-containing protein/signal transduction histidine kinase
MRVYDDMARIGLVSSVVGLLLAACSGLSSVSAPTPSPVTSVKTVTQKIPEEKSLPVVSGALRFERLGLEDGLSQSTVHAILQDKLGFLWIGTEDGLNRYDGYTFQIYRPDPENPEGINDRWITYLYEDSQGYLWIGTRLGGLNRYDPNTGIFTHLMHEPENENSLAGNRVNVILEDRQGYLWIGTNDGLDRLNLETGEIKHFRNESQIASSISSNYITALFEDSFGTLWIGTYDGGLNRFNTSALTFRAYSSFCYLETQEYCVENTITREGGFAEVVQDCRMESDYYCDSIHAISEDQDGNLWIATNDGLSRLNLEHGAITRFRPFNNQSASLSDNTILSLYIDRTGTLWAGTNDGLIRFNKKTQEFTYYKSVDGDSASLSNDTVTSIFEDAGGILWVGTYGGGLNKYNRGQHKFTYYHHDPTNPNSLSSNFISPIHADKHGMIWMGTLGGGLNRFNPGPDMFTHYQRDSQNPGSLLSDEITSVYMDRNETLWVGSDQGLSRLDLGEREFTHYRYDRRNPNGLSGAPVYALYQDKSGVLWVGTAKGLDQFDPLEEKFIHFGTDLARPENLRNNIITAILEDHHGELWVGTLDSGLIHINAKRNDFIHYQYDPNDLQGIAHNSITAIYQDSIKRLWIATAGGGLHRYNWETNTFIQKAEKDGLPSNVIYGIVEDKSAQLWLSTNFGISRFDPQTETFRNYTASDGLQGNEFNMYAFARADNDTMYFGGINGLTVFRPSDVTDSMYIPAVMLTSFGPREQPRPEMVSDVALAWPNNNFSFEFSSLDYAQPDRNQYAYILENFDKDWNYIGNNREGRYTNLPGGSYILRLRGSNSDGIWNESEQTIRVTVIPPFWNTWTFRILLILSAIAFVLIIYRLRVRSIQTQNLQLESLVRERTGALQKRTEELEALYSGDERIIRAMTLDQIFQAIVEVAAEMLHADRGAVFVWDEDRNQIVPHVSHKFRSETLKVLHFEKGEGMIGKVLETGEPLIIREIDLDALRPDIRAAIIDEGIHSLVNLPIKVNEQTIGVFNVGFTRPGATTEDTMRLYTALVQRAALSVENMQLFEQTKELAVIEERNRVARDLHDSAKQKAFAALAQLGAVNGILKNDPDNAWSHLDEAENLVYEVIQELTFLIQEMYPMALKEKGLATTLREYIFEWENRNGVMINLVIQNARRMPLETEQAIYRMIQEALANVARHSQADRVYVSLIYNAETLAVEVEDNGLGFNAKHKAGGMGLRIINERAESIGGQACVQSEPGLGTKVVITAPLNGYL